MTDTDKLKRLADELKDVASAKNEHGYLFVSRSEAEAILALIAENERLSGALKAANDGFERHERLWYLAKDQRDEAVALLRANMMYPDDGKTARETQAFLARIDGDT